MKNANIPQNAVSHEFDENDMSPRETGIRFTPGQFFREVGTLIAVCLGLGLLAQVMLS